MSQISREVGIIRGENSPTWLSPEEIERSPIQLNPGDQLVTGRRSSATLALSDQTVIRMRPQTEVALSDDGRNRIILPSGSIRATVAPQSPGHPLMFATSNSEVLVLGTELELLTSGERSAVAVMEGSVQVTRTSDNATTTLSSGKFVSILQSGEFSVVSWPQPPSKWSLDFEHGLPSGWRGRKVAVGLPENSQGGLLRFPYWKMVKSCCISIHQLPRMVCFHGTMIRCYMSHSKSNHRVGSTFHLSRGRTTTHGHR